MSQIKGPRSTDVATPRSAVEQADAADRVAASGTRTVDSEQRLHQKEVDAGLAQAKSAKAKQMSSADAERLISQAGYQSGRARKKDKNFDAGDSSSAPIPLPSEDLEDGAWSQSGLEEAQSSLNTQSGILKDVAESLPEEQDLEKFWQAALMRALKPTEEENQRLEAIQTQEKKEPVAQELPLAETLANSEAFFGKSLGQIEPGQVLIAASLLVAGDSNAVQVEDSKTESGKKTLNGHQAAHGVQKVMQSSQEAVEDAKKMNQGINKNLSMHRTFVFKR